MPSTRERGRRRYGQHFLKDPVIICRIVEASGVAPGDAILEIGPGRGDLTRVLSERAGTLLAIEIDRHLYAELAAASWPSHVSIRQGNALELSGSDLAQALGTDYHLVSNLPYEITSATLVKFLRDTDPKPRSMTLMLQREVGERVTASLGRMNRLAVFCGYYAEDVRIALRVPRGAFSPPPEVESCVLRLVPRRTPLLPVEAERRLFVLTEAAFAQNRKQLRNSLGNLLGSDPAERLQAAGIAPEARPEDIPLESWIHLASNV